MLTKIGPKTYQTEDGFPALPLWIDRPNRKSSRFIHWSGDDGYDMGEAAEDGADLAREEGRKGYAYCTMQDVDCVIHIGRLYFGFSSLDNPGDESDAEIGQAVVEALEEVGFTPEWNGKQTGRITCEGLKFELPLAD